MEHTTVTIDRGTLEIIKSKDRNFNLSDFVRKHLDIEAGLKENDEISENDRLKRQIVALTNALEDVNKRLLESGAG